MVSEILKSAFKFLKNMFSFLLKTQQDSFLINRFRIFLYQFKGLTLDGGEYVYAILLLFFVILYTLMLSCINCWK